MCISANPAELNNTIIANFPQAGSDEQHRVLSYMNTVESVAGSQTTDPNAMVFPVYGEVTSLLECPDPRASRAWLEGKRGVYEEGWYDITATRSASADAESKLHVIGNYLVGVSDSIEDIPRVLSDMRRGPVPDHVPHIPDSTLASMDTFYRAQDLGVPQFVIAAFLLPPHYRDDKNPITLAYTQWEHMADKMVFPALDYHGHGAFDAYARRQHRLLFSTRTLENLLQPAMTASTAATPAEFAAAPTEFPVCIEDYRRAHIKDQAQRAPNNDYIIDLEPIHHALQGADDEIQAVTDNTELSAYNRDQAIGAVLAKRLGKYGMMQYSNQPGTTVEEFYGEDEDSDVLYIKGTDNW